MVRAQGAIVGWTATVDQVLAALEEIVTDARCLRHALGLSGSASNPAG